MEIKEMGQFFTSKWVKQYFTNRADVHPFYEYAPLEEDAFKNRARDLDSIERAHAPREKLAEVITSFHEPELTHPEIARNIDRLSQLDSLVVIGGHQACLLTGPLYTVYKAITLIQLAQREERRLGRPIIPVFWIAGEDHDWDEVNHVWIHDSQKPVKFRFSQGLSRRQVSDIEVIPREIHAWVDQLSRLLPDSKYKHEWIRILKEFTSTPITWSRFFARIIHFLFGKYGLLLVDSADPKLREIEKPFMNVLLSKNNGIQNSIQETQNKIVAMGHAPSVPHKKNFAHLFFAHHGNRYPLYYNEKKWTVPGLNKEWTSSQMSDLANDSPHHLSNNVLTRPLMQEYLFPTLATVGGLAEVTYWGMLKDTFTLCDLRMPIVYPRSQVTLIPDVIRKRMHDFELLIEDIYACYEDKKNDWLEKQNPVTMASLFKEAKQEIELIHEGLLNQLEEKLKVNLLESGQINRNKITEHLVYLKRYADQAIQRKYESQLKHWIEIEEAILPLNKPQERIYNFINYWNAYGLGWIDDLINNSLLSDKGIAYAASIR